MTDCKHEMTIESCTLCTPPRQSMAVIVAVFPARFDSDCDHCGGRMLAGVTICRTQAGDYIHKSCSDPIRWGARSL